MILEDAYRISMRMIGQSSQMGLNPRMKGVGVLTRFGGEIAAISLI